MARKRAKRVYPPKTCRGCKSKFLPKRASQVYHDGDCRRAHYMETYFFRPEFTKTCRGCGEEFQTTAPKKQEYHDDECRRVHAVQRMRDAQADHQRLKELERAGALVNQNPDKSIP